jgi:hypothetical protein
MRAIVAMCCFCEKVRDDTGTEPGGGPWQAFKFYIARHMLRPEEVMFSHTYCPGCLSVYRDFLTSPKGASHGPEMEKGA